MPLDIKRIRGICFDIDGTLSDTDDHMVERVSRGLAAFQPLLLGQNPKDVARRFVMGIETPGNFIMGIPDRLGFDRPLAVLAERINRLAFRGRRHHFWLIPRVLEMLDALQGRYPLAVVSARDETVTGAFLEQFDLAGRFTAVAAAHTCQHTKPFPDPILFAAEKMGLSPGEVVMVGDTTVDMRAGKAAGAQAIGVLCGFGQEAELRRAGADLILPATPLVAEILLDRNSG
jgi:HAD superfamily hydrolase (TIGR01549 family)